MTTTEIRNELHLDTQNFLRLIGLALGDRRFELADDTTGELNLIAELRTDDFRHEAIVEAHAKAFAEQIRPDLHRCLRRRMGVDPVAHWTDPERGLQILGMCMWNPVRDCMIYRFEAAFAA